MTLRSAANDGSPENTVHSESADDPKDYQVTDISGQRDRWRPAVLRAGVLAAVAATITLLASACGGSSTSSTSGLMSLSSLTNQALAYAKCMRAHGIPEFPDPTVQDNAQNKGVGFSMPSGVDRTRRSTCRPPSCARSRRASATSPRRNCRRA
jgi:hypothetical protein